MKRTLTAIATAALLAGAASAQVVPTPDVETLDYALSGFVESECELATSNGTSRNVIMTAENAQGITALTFSCNSPYTLTVSSLNGGMEHQQSGGTLLIPYQLRTGGAIPTGGTTSYVFYTSDQLSSPQVLDSTTDWLSLASNEGTRQINLDVMFTDDTYAVAGNYSDVLTITLTPNL